VSSSGAKPTSSRIRRATPHRDLPPQCGRPALHLRHAVPGPHAVLDLQRGSQDPHVTVHLKGETVADIPATARVVNDPAERRPLIETAAKTWGRTDIDVMLEHSPLVEVTVEDYPRGVPANPAKG
jgi:hypothetical protein